MKKNYFFPFLHPHGKIFSVGSRITSSAIAVATQPPTNSSRCSPSTFLGLLLSRENSDEPNGGTLPVRKTLKTHTAKVVRQRNTGRCLHFVFFDDLRQLFYRFRLSILSCCSIFAWGQITDCWCSVSTVSPLRCYGAIHNTTVVLNASGLRCGDRNATKIVHGTKVNKKVLKINWQLMFLVLKCVLNFSGFMLLAASNSLDRRGCAAIYI